MVVVDAVVVLCQFAVRPLFRPRKRTLRRVARLSRRKQWAETAVGQAARDIERAEVPLVVAPARIRVDGHAIYGIVGAAPTGVLVIRGTSRPALVLGALLLFAVGGGEIRGTLGLASPAGLGTKRFDLLFSILFGLFFCRTYFVSTSTMI